MSAFLCSLIGLKRFGSLGGCVSLGPAPASGSVEGPEDLPGLFSVQSSFDDELWTGQEAFHLFFVHPKEVCQRLLQHGRIALLQDTSEQYHPVCSSLHRLALPTVSRCPEKCLSRRNRSAARTIGRMAEKIERFFWALIIVPAGRHCRRFGIKGRPYPLLLTLLRERAYCPHPRRNAGETPARGPG